MGGSEAAPVVRTVACMGTVASVHVHDDAGRAAIDAAIDAAFAELERIEADWSTFRPTSLVSRINRGELALLDAGPEVLEVLDACTWLEHVSGGAFRARPPERPDRLDPAGFVKGWATERAARCLDLAGLRSWTFSVGGDLVARGTRPDGSAWRVGLTDPLVPGRAIGMVEVVDSAVATSGTAERGAHLWDGRSGERVAPVASMTVIGPHLTWADAFATAAFAMGEDGLAWVGGFDGYHAIAVRHDGALIASPDVERAPEARATPPRIP